MIGYGSIMFNAIDFCMTHGVRLEMKPDINSPEVLRITISDLVEDKAITRRVDFLELHSLSSWAMVNNALKRQLVEMLRELKGEEWYASNCDQYNWFRFNV